MPGPDPRKARLMQGPKGGVGKMSPKEKKKKEDFIIVIDDKYISDPKKFGMDEIVIMNPEKKAMGGGMMDMTRMRYLKGGQV